MFALVREPSLPRGDHQGADSSAVPGDGDDVTAGIVSETEDWTLVLTPETAWATAEDEPSAPPSESPNDDQNGSQNKPDNRVRVLKGKLLLVDLAGCERVGKSGAEGTTFDEAIAINLHLHALGKCIAALALNGADNANSTNTKKDLIGNNDGSNSPTHVHVPYRESKLTRLLKDSLGGTAMTSLIVTVAPGAGTFLTSFPYH